MCDFRGGRGVRIPSPTYLDPRIYPYMYHTKTLGKYMFIVFFEMLRAINEMTCLNGYHYCCGYLDD